METWIEDSRRKAEKPIPPPYMEIYYNLHFFQNLASPAPTTYLARVLNTLQEAVNDRPRLPRHLVVLIDMDIMAEFNLQDDEFDPEKEFKRVLTYLTKQINITIRRKRLILTEKKPGSVYGEHPKIIYVKTLR